MTRTAVEGGQATWFATGPACQPGMETTPWETERLLVSVRFELDQAVLTHEAVVARADRICRRAGRSLGDLPARVERLRKANDVRAIIRLLREIAMTVRGVHRRLGRLAIPPARASSILRARRRAVVSP